MRYYVNRNNLIEDHGQSTQRRIAELIRDYPRSKFLLVVDASDRGALLEALDRLDQLDAAGREGMRPLDNSVRSFLAQRRSE